MKPTDLDAFKIVVTRKRGRGSQQRWTEPKAPHWHVMFEWMPSGVKPGRRAFWFDAAAFVALVIVPLNTHPLIYRSNVPINSEDIWA